MTTENPDGIPPRLRQTPPPPAPSGVRAVIYPVIRQTIIRRRGLQRVFIPIDLCRKA